MLGDGVRTNWMYGASLEVGEVGSTTDLAASIRAFTQEAIRRQAWYYNVDQTPGWVNP